jgi:glycosyltransferase involved in cell wall biosynthesis
VVGFHGYGGQEYAHAGNGLWCAPDQAEETADALAQMVEAFRDGDAAFAALREAGKATAAHYTRERTRAALAAFYGRLST